VTPPTAVLFDFAGTLLVPEPRAAWIAAVCPELPAPAATELADQLDRAGRPGGPDPVALPPELAAAYASRDVSTDRHRAVYEALLATVVDQDLARRLYERSTAPEGWAPYPDALPVLSQLRARGVPVAVVSNVGFDLRAVFAGHGLAELVTTFVLSCEIGVMKPDWEIFRTALAALDLTPQQALMVGDDPRSDGAAVTFGIRTLLLPYSQPGDPHGLDAVLRLAGGV
jgi:HAD superfamily hydrolase (TIGR01509 family)